MRSDRIHFDENARSGFYQGLWPFQNDSKQNSQKESVALGVDARKGDLGLRNSERSPYLAPRRVGPPVGRQAHPPPPGGNRSLREKSLDVKHRKPFGKK